MVHTSLWLKVDSSARGYGLSPQRRAVAERKNFDYSNECVLDKNNLPDILRAV
jgi:hypothetical protein